MKKPYHLILQFFTREKNIWTLKELNSGEQVLQADALTIAL